MPGRRRRRWGFLLARDGRRPGRLRHRPADSWPGRVGNWPPGWGKIGALTRPSHGPPLRRAAARGLMGSNRWLRNSVVYLLIIIGVIVVVTTILPSLGGGNEKPFTEVVDMAKSNSLARIVVDGNTLTAYPQGQQQQQRAGAVHRPPRLQHRHLYRAGRKRGHRGRADGRHRGVQGLQRVQPFRGAAAELPAADFLRRADSVYDAPGPGQQQPDAELWPQPGAG